MFVFWDAHRATISRLSPAACVISTANVATRASDIRTLECCISKVYLTDKKGVLNLGQHSGIPDKAVSTLRQYAALQTLLACKTTGATFSHGMNTFLKILSLAQTVLLAQFEL
jgi:hypothetical protein